LGKSIFPTGRSRAAIAVSLASGGVLIFRGYSIGFEDDIVDSNKLRFGGIVDVD
jgi:hypothetical protein